MSGEGLLGDGARWSQVENPNPLEDFAKWAEYVKNAPPHPCSLGQHVISPKARFKPGTYMCGNCGSSVKVPYPLVEHVYPKGEAE